jgi:hypothetical protein
MRAALRDAAVCRWTLLERRVLEAVISFTAGYSRLSDRVAIAELARMVFCTATPSGWERDRVGLALRRLAALEIVVYEPGRGRSSMPLVGLPKAGPDEPVFPDEKHGLILPGFEPETRADFARNTSRFRAKASSTGGHTEKTSEKTPEKRSRPARAPARRERARDPLFDAIVGCWNLDPAELTRDGRGKINKAVQQLREIGADPAEIPRRREVYRVKYPTVADSPLAVVGHWAELASLDDGARLPKMPRGYEHTLKAAERLTHRTATNGDSSDAIDVSSEIRP